MPRRVDLCGTYGCTLPNNHRGLHQFPQDESRRKRAKPDTSSTGRESVKFDHEPDPTSTSEPGPDPDGEPDDDFSGDDVEDEDEDDVEDEDEDDVEDEDNEEDVEEGEEAMDQPEHEVEEEEGEADDPDPVGAGGRASSRARFDKSRPRPCKKTPYCSRWINHPGLCKTPQQCEKQPKCWRPFKHQGKCMIPAPCLKDARCARAQGHSGLCRIVKLTGFVTGFDEVLPVSRKGAREEPKGAKAVPKLRPVAARSAAAAAEATEAVSSTRGRAAIQAALEFVPGPVPEGDGSENGQAQRAHINPLRCTRHHLCVRGRKHPGLCKMLEAFAPVIDRILGKASTTIYLQGRSVVQQVYLVQHEGRSRAQAVWEPATRILDDVAFQAFENEIEPVRRFAFDCH